LQGREEMWLALCGTAWAHSCHVNCRESGWEHSQISLGMSKGDGTRAGRRWRLYQPVVNWRLRSL